MKSIRIRIVRAVAALALVAGSAQSVKADFTLKFDEQGNGTLDTGSGPVSNPGAMLPDPSNGGVLALTYFLGGNLVGEGDVTINDIGGSVSDGIRFTDAAGNLGGGGGDRMIFYSGDSGQLADTGFPSNFSFGYVGATEDANDGFVYNVGNVYIGKSGFAPAPEPSTFALAGLGGLGLIGYGWRKRRRAIA